MLPTKFRRQLRREADLWAQEGLIDRTTHDRLAQRYQFSALDVESRNSLITLLMGLGCVLIGIGVLTFISANWQQLTREWRVGILLGAFITVNLLGFYLWREPAGGKHRFGQGLLLLGAMMLGGNMALMGQMFHVRGELFQLSIAWAVGVLLMAYSLRMTSLGILAQILMCIGYWQAYTSGLWSSDRLEIDANWTYFAFQHMPIVATCLFLPLAYWCRSQAIFTLTGIAFLSSFQSHLLQQSIVWDAKGIPVMNLAIACSLPPLLLWGYGNLSQWWQDSHRNKIGAFPQSSRRLGAFSLGLSCFTLSLIPYEAMLLTASRTSSIQYSLTWDGVIFTLVTIGIWLYLIWQARNNARHFPWNRTTTALVIASCAVFAAIFARVNAVAIEDLLKAISIGSTSPVATLVFLLISSLFWVLLFAVTIGLIRSGLANSDRGTFWFGLGLLASRIMIWFLMTQNDLTTKSLLFVVSGIAVIAVGFWFERYVRRLSEAKVN
jgi:uncharacterized membrane protein